MRDLRACGAILLTLSAIAACSGQGAQPAGPATDTSRNVTTRATFAQGAGTAITYDTALVPVGASATVTSTSGGGATKVTLEVSGLAPERQYGAHAHTKACGPTPPDAGPHFQHQKDPVAPSVDPAYANPQNEIWLDFRTDAQGNGTATSTVSWDVTDAAHPQSVVVHAHATATEPGKAGTAGDRAGCVTVNF